MRRSLALAAIVLSALSGSLAACGGSVTGLDPVDTGGGETEGDVMPDTGGWVPDTSYDTGGWVPDTSYETGPGGCGFGACSTGEACFDGCNECYCTAPGEWSCTAKYCEDTGTDSYLPPPDTYSDSYLPPPDVYPVCPGYLPSVGSYCSAPMKCAYSNACGSTDVAYCEFAGGRWNVSKGPCTEYCPPYLPKEGSSCSGGAKCDYWKPCGTSDYAWCDPSTSKWRVSYTSCPPPPPPPPVCPTTMPKEGSACVSYESCAWNNGCGALTYGYCESGSWWLSDSGCPGGCPSTKPVSGAACKPPSSTSCTYVAPSPTPGYCESNCFCAEDYRWACIPGGCSSSGGGGWADAGGGPFESDAGTPKPY